EIGLKEIPDIYICHGSFNAFVTKFARKKYLMLYSEVIETALMGDTEVLKFVIGHELGHLKRQHLNKEVWLTPSLLIPFLKQAHSRGCEYTCDRIGHYFSTQGSFEGILILATGKEIFSKINIQRYIDDAHAENGFWVWFSEKFLSHPHIYKRLSAIKNYAEKRY
ncbi:M48 family metallopeptidase, partial [Mangrovivirga sp. M17]